jgi:hypothetical protein
VPTLLIHPASPAHSPTLDPTFLAGGLALTVTSMALAFLAGCPFVAFALKAGIRATFLTS